MSNSESRSRGRTLCETSTNFLEAARIRVEKGKVIYHGADHNGLRLVLPEQPKDDDGNPVPLEIEATLHDYYVRMGAITEKNTMIIKRAEP